MDGQIFETDARQIKNPNSTDQAGFGLGDFAWKELASQDIVVHCGRMNVNLECQLKRIVGEIAFSQQFFHSLGIGSRNIGVNLN